MCVLFAPEREGACAAIAWCQMEGRMARVPLALQGQGLGPLVGSALLSAKRSCDALCTGGSRPAKCT